jgi:hypothetical protein
MSNICNYWLISRLNTLSKLFEKLLEPKLSSVFRLILDGNEHGFCKSKSTVSNWNISINTIF